MLGRYGEPSEIARVAVFLASNEASYITGTTRCRWRYEHMSKDSVGLNGILDNLVTRRTVLVGAAGAALGVGITAAGSALAQPRRENFIAPTVDAKEIYPNDPRYSAFQSGINNRFVGHPDVVKLVRNADDAARSLQEAVNRGVGVGCAVGDTVHPISLRTMEFVCCSIFRR
ncbi:SDR family oxidoreductase [Klebsiella pneumoniae]|nr:SDR family oxidoreductase [Klebsiella pneumoniae]